METTGRYRRTRAAVRDAAAAALDELDAVHHALAYGDPGAARVHAQRLALVTDDILALVEQLRLYIVSSN